jgi:[lysine-biosynthesis-protein LysW]---L-2-aminoadipate ligase
MVVRIGFIYSRIRPEERFLIEEIERRDDVELVRLYDTDSVFDLSNLNTDVDVILARSISHSRNLYALQMYEQMGIPVVNTSEVVRICGDKLLTSLALERNNIPTPRVLVAFAVESALRAMDEIGYPCVLKPVIGSWGRLISRIDNREIAESILEHKSMLGPNHSIFYIQEYVPKINGRDIRSFVINGECVTAIYRTSDHWITNTSRGGNVSECDVELVRDISIRAAQAVGGGMVAVDLFETSEGLVVNEINHTMEFRNSMHSVNIPEKIIDYVLEVGSRD